MSFLVSLFCSISLFASMCSPQLGALSILKASQGGTGIGTATAGDVGKVLKVSDDDPFTFILDTDNTGAGGSFPFDIKTNFGSTTFSSTTPYWARTGLFASSTSYFDSLSATNATSTNLGVTLIQAIGSGGVDFHSSNGTQILQIGGGGGSNATFSGGVNIDGTTRLATSLTGLAYTTSGTVSAVTNGTGGQILSMVNGVPAFVATTTFSSGLSYSAGNVTNTGVLSITATSPITRDTATGAVTIACATCLTSSTGVSSITGTANQITASASVGAVTLSLPNQVNFPLGFSSAQGSTTNATSTNLHIIGLSAGGLGVDGNGKVYSGATTTAGTGLTFSGGAFNVNTSQNIATLSNLTTDGYVKTGGGAGTLSVQAVPIPATDGGTAQTTYTKGDLLYSSATNVLSKLGIGTGGYVLGVSDGLPVWVSTSSITAAPAGTNGQIQYNNNSATGAIGNSFWNSAKQTLGLGTTTPQWLLQLATSTAPQLTLSDASLTAAHWSFRTINGILYISSSSPSTFATSTNALMYFGASNGLVAIGSTTPTIGKMSITADNSTSNALYITGNTNSFLEANIQNNNSGSSASSDFTATANNGTASSVYVDFGINGSGGGAAPFTTANQGYIYHIDNTFNIGALGSSAELRFFTTGGTSPVQQAVIAKTGAFGIGTSTPTRLLTLATSTNPQLRFTDSSLTADQWNFRSNGNNFMLATSSASTGATSTRSVIEIDTNGTLTLGKLLTVANGGTGAATFTANGVLYGNTTSAISVTAQGGANTILTANSGAPAFSSSPVIGTSVTSPIFYGGSAAGSTHTIRSTSGVGVGVDAIIFGTGNNGANENFRLTLGGAGFGTTTPKWLVQLATSTAPQLTLSDNGSITNNHWSFRNIAGKLFFATTSPSTYSTSTASGMWFDINGRLNTQKSLSVTDGSTARYISGFNDRTLLLASTTPGDRDFTTYQTGTSTFYVWNPFKAQTLLSVHCRTSNNTLIVNVGTGSATTTNGSNGDIVCTPTGTTYTMTTNNAYSARGNILISAGSATTTDPNNVTITTTWTEQAD